VGRDVGTVRDQNSVDAYFNDLAIAESESIALQAASAMNSRIATIFHGNDHL